MTKMHFLLLSRNSFPLHCHLKFTADFLFLTFRCQLCFFFLQTTNEIEIEDEKKQFL
jgi:hypothetical protein